MSDELIDLIQKYGNAMYNTGNHAAIDAERAHNASQRSAASYLSAIRAALAKREAVAEDADPSGYTPQGNPAESASKIVPPAITDFMIDAGVSELQRYCFSEGVHTIHDDDACRNIFTAMLAASQSATGGAK